jgi:membrane protease YdiL (CAAX protease family)
MFLALVFSMRSNWKPILQLRKDLEKIRPVFSNSKPIDLALIAFFAGVGEEFFFRGWMQNALVHRSGAILGILITSAIFGLLHYLSTTYAIYALITSIYLGMIYFITGNLYIVMAIHVLYDFVALVVLMNRKENPDSSE